jgi:hypothetical protein
MPKQTSTAMFCGVHFTEDRFENLMTYKAGVARKLNLKKDAVPTSHPRHQKKKKQPLQRPSVHSCTCKSTLHQHFVTIISWPDHTVNKKPRRASSKLEVARVS